MPYIFCVAVALLLSLFSAAASAQMQDCRSLAIPPGEQIELETLTGLKYKGRFREEQKEGNDVFWELSTDSGTTRVPRSAIQSCRFVQPIRTEQPTRIDRPAVQSNYASLELRVHGSNTVGARFAPELARAMAAASGLTASVKTIVREREENWVFSTAESDRKHVFHFQARGSGTAFTNLVAGVADVGMASRPVNEKEIAAIGAAGLGDPRAFGAENVIALDGVAVIRHRQNPVTTLTLDQIARIFSGEVTDWSAVGGHAGSITIYSRDSHSGTFDTFNALVLEPSRRRLSPNARLFESSEELSQAVSSAGYRIYRPCICRQRGASANRHILRPTFRGRAVLRQVGRVPPFTQAVLLPPPDAASSFSRRVRTLCVI